MNNLRMKGQLQQRIRVANAVLQTLREDLNISWEDRKGVCVSWKTWKGREIKKRWIFRNNGSFFPAVNVGDVGFGGTGITAISQLVRYCQGRSHLPLSTWKYWGGDHVRLWEDLQKRDLALAILEDSDYSKSPVCMFCGQSLTGRSWDWFSFSSGEEGVGCWGKKCQKIAPPENAMAGNHGKEVAA